MSFNIMVDIHSKPIAFFWIFLFRTVWSEMLAELPWTDKVVTYVFVDFENVLL